MNINLANAFDMIGSYSPQDILYHITYSNNDLMVVFVPKTFFEINNCLSDKPFNVKEIELMKLDYGFQEVAPGAYSFNTSFDQLEAALKALGFVKSEEFSKFVDIITGVKKDDSKIPSKIKELIEGLDSIKAEFNQKYKTDKQLFNHDDFLIRVNTLVESVMGFKIADLQQLICDYVKSNAPDMANKVNYIAENNDFGDNYFDEKPKMIESIKRGATSLDAWKLKAFGAAPNIENHSYFTFGCEFLNGGEDFDGIVCVDDYGQIKHHFVQLSIVRS